MANLQPAASYWLTPLASDEDWTAIQAVQTYVSENHVFAFTQSGPKNIKAGDWICFYIAGRGVVGHARISSEPATRPHSVIRNPKKFSRVCDLKDIVVYIDNPIAIDAKLREQLDAFKGRDPKKMWAWFVRRSIKLSKHDFQLLTSSSK